WAGHLAGGEEAGRGGGSPAAGDGRRGGGGNYRLLVDAKSVAMDRRSPVLHGLLRPPSHAATTKGGAGHRRAAVGSGAERSAAGGARRQGRAGGRPCGPPTTESVLHTASRDASAAAPLLPALLLKGLDDVLSLLSPTSPPNHLVLGPPHRGSRPLSLPHYRDLRSPPRSTASSPSSLY
uniref:Uncharacterized protein n=1 Tax=Oryza glaberrima TaxID=4538 RepID=I1PCS4_ORYGL